MRQISSLQSATYPEGVTVEAKGRTLTIKGARGTLVRNFDHLNIEIKHNAKTRTIEVGKWFGNRKQVASVRTVLTHINNLIIGVTKGYEYKMRYVYAHFPINVTVEKAKTVEVRNFLGERIVRSVEMLDGVTAKISDSTKDEIVISGNDIELVAQSAANIQQCVLVKNKDIRKFLDGIYVSERGNIVKE